MIKLLFLFITIPSIAFCQTRDVQFINQFSSLTGQAFKSDYSRQNYYSFVEYVISKKTSVGGLLNASKINSDYKNGTTQYALFGPEVFHRYKFFAKGKHGGIVHNAIKMPNFYNENKHLGLMPKQYDYELRFIGLYNFKERLVSSIVHDSTPYFIRYELAYRKRFHTPFDEVRFAFWGGFDIGHNLEVLIQDNITWNIQTKGSNALNNTYRNFDITKDANNIATLSLFYHLSKHTALQFGYAQRIHGNNPFYDNRGIIFSIWNSVI